MSVVDLHPANAVQMTARQALRRLVEGDDPMIGRATRIAVACAAKGEIGLLAVDDFPDSGRVMVPTVVLRDLLAIAAARMVTP